MKKKIGFLFGTDPEFFISDDSGRVVPAETVVPTKEAGKPVYCDNAAIELTVSPASTPRGLVTSVHEILTTEVNPLLIEHKLKPLWVSATEIEQKWFERCAHLCEFGCEPSMVIDENGFAKISVPRINPLTTNQRSAGCHLHLGLNPEFAEITEELLFSPQMHMQFTRLCDLFLGIPSIIIKFGEDDNIRRNVVGYGRASEFRPQPWGFEYRSLPSWVLSNSKWLYVFTALLNDAALLLSILRSFPEEFNHQEVANAVNNGDVVYANQLWKRVNSMRKNWKALCDYEIPAFSIIFGSDRRFNQFNRIIHAKRMPWRPAPNFSHWPYRKMF